MIKKSQFVILMPWGKPSLNFQMKYSHKSHTSLNICALISLSMMKNSFRSILFVAKCCIHLTNQMKVPLFFHWCLIKQPRIQLWVSARVRLHSRPGAKCLYFICEHTTPGALLFFFLLPSILSLSFNSWKRLWKEIMKLFLFFKSMSVILCLRQIITRQIRPSLRTLQKVTKIQRDTNFCTFASQFQLVICDLGCMCLYSKPQCCWIL